MKPPKSQQYGYERILKTEGKSTFVSSESDPDAYRLRAVSSATSEDTKSDSRFVAEVLVADASPIGSPKFAQSGRKEQPDYSPNGQFSRVNKSQQNLLSQKAMQEYRISDSFVPTFGTPTHSQEPKDETTSANSSSLVPEQLFQSQSSPLSQTKKRPDAVRKRSSRSMIMVSADS